MEYNEQCQRLWCEPWRSADPSWLQAGTAPAPWLGFSNVSPEGLRLAYAIWARHFALASKPPTTCLESTRKLLHDVSLAQPNLAQPNLAHAALFIGMVTLVSHPIFSAWWVLNHRAAATIAKTQIWRRASALARARPLMSDPTGQLASGNVDAGLLVTLGWCHMRSAIEHMWPGAWSRLFFLCDAQRVRNVTALRPSLPCGNTTASEVRHIMRVWRIASIQDN